ncbi:hypothetical protein E7Z59_12045 [Robertkochia marina]|uniref:Phospholipase/carboxylesterase/thioesterase domain-containing protein n=1 Tax=Robertkochia marina TaxID=1227945 RepID=A0A4S3LY86_9FLAO|nr:PHB depolymerase family esterase [Robertkochia marina]THD66522.1 hypothetical protein E7Z59_12045 [Robertkochia marina]TRZ45637.1 hypothetical protein D3A96_06590 [Robertkochia marina]
MKPLFFITILLFTVTGCTDQDDHLTPINIVNFDLGKTVQRYDHNGQNREYLLYIPPNIEERSGKVPLVFSFHGLNGTSEGMYSLTRFHELADINGFIAAYPQALPINGSNRWNDSNDLSNGKPDDQEFIKGLTDMLIEQLPVDPDRVYLSGFSNGAHFSFHQFCQYADYAAVAGVGGGMNWVALNMCTTTMAKPVMQIHGTDDKVVPYTQAETAIHYWVEQNNTENTPIITQFPDTDPNDGSTVQEHRYTGGANDMDVHHLKVIGGGHHWPGPHGNKDINASEEIWKFFSLYSLSGRIGS